MGPSFNEQFDQHGAWRRAFAQQLKQLAEWMSNHDLMDAAVQERLQRLEGQVRTDKVMVAFVAEFSRGKSELINAIFFADYGRRIMPASAGRTTMCPTELGYDSALPPSLRLLPIETRLQMQGLADWRLKPERWVEIALDVNNADQIAKALEKVSEIRRVSIEDARALGFWHDDLTDENPVPDVDGLVEVPMWRHALIYQTETSDILLVQINPIEHLELPHSGPEIMERMNEVTFNASLLAEMRAIEFVRRLLAEGKLDARRYKSVRMHRIDGGSVLAPFGADSKLRADLAFVRKLFALGRTAGQEWLHAHRKDVGVRPSIKIADNA